MTTDFEPTDLWPCRWTCDVMTESPIITGLAVQSASSILWVLTGRQFGFTETTIRPCRDYHRETPYPDGWLSWPGTQSPPLGATSSGGFYGYWIYGGCGSCIDNCGCTMLQQFTLPSPVSSISEIKIDGQILDPSAYRLDENRYVVRVDGGIWPRQNDFSLPDTSIGTWSVTARYGLNIPDGAALAVGELACEIIRGINGGDCRVPRTVTQLARQGVTIQFPSIVDSFKNGLTGLYLTDLFINTWNPSHLRRRAKTYSIDGNKSRRIG